MYLLDAVENDEELRNKVTEEIRKDMLKEPRGAVVMLGEQNVCPFCNEEAPEKEMPAHIKSE